MNKKEMKSEFRYAKGSPRLPLFGVGPVYVFVTGTITVLVILMDHAGMLPAVRPAWGHLLFRILGISCILSGIALWGSAVFMDSVVRGIRENRLVTRGAYACVRNPIYTAFTLLFCGALLINGNMLTFFLPILFGGWMTMLLKRTEEKWLSERYGSEYEAYCSKVHRCIPGVPDRDAVYQSDISDHRWMAYDLPGNLGWILYFAGLIFFFSGKPAFTDPAILLQMMIAAIFPALLMLTGIIELISERIHKLDRVLPRIRLWRGFGALTLGGVTGGILSGIILAFAVSREERLAASLMLAGSILCSVFAWLLLRRYRRK